MRESLWKRENRKGIGRERSVRESLRKREKRKRILTEETNRKRILKYNTIFGIFRPLLEG